MILNLDSPVWGVTGSVVLLCLDKNVLTKSSSGKANIIIFLWLYKSENIKRKLLKFRQILPKFYAYRVEMLAWGYCMGIKIVWGGGNRLLYEDLAKYRHAVLMQ